MTGRDATEARPAAPDAAPPPVTGRRSAALKDRERIVPDRPEWAATSPPPRAPLPILTRNALTRPQTRAATDRLVELNRVWNKPGWSPEMAALREQGAAIRRETLRDLEGYLARLTDSVRANGGVVHRATTPADAVEVVERIARDNGVRLVVKSKSMATEEVHLTHHLEAAGIETVETDLGEYIVQLADERPSHIIAPAVHRSQAEIADLFSQLAGEQLERERPEELAAFARRRLRADFHRADMGISGVNFAAADTGTLTIVTNEGNGRMVTSQPRIHVAVMTMEKVIPRFRDLAVLLPLLCYAATKQRLSVYQTMITGPRREGELDGPEQLHLVILDNGRSGIVGTRYEEVLACIRCGACQVACPVYRTVGGHGYGATYGGPIGAVLSPLIGDRDEAADLPFLSSLCGNCYDVCPVKIPLPDMLVDLRADYEATAARRRPRHWAWRAWAALWSTPGGFRATTAAVRLGSLLPRSVVRRLPGPAKGWAAGRELPPGRQAGAFRAWMASRARGS
jgi:L-lactate dehydrogenase complex protein LldF